MATASISLELDADTARAFSAASAEDRRKLRQEDIVDKWAERTDAVDRAGTWRCEL